MRKRRFRQANYATEAEILSISSKAVREDIYVSTDTNKIFWIDYDGNPQIINSGGGGGGANLSIGTITGTTVDVNSDTGTNATIPASTTNKAGVMSSIDKVKLNSTETSSQLNARDTANRNRTNHTGTQTASTISDFDIEVSNNSNVTANTGKVSADGSINTHSDVNTVGASAGDRLIFNGSIWVKDTKAFLYLRCDVGVANIGTSYQSLNIQNILNQSGTDFTSTGSGTEIRFNKAGKYKVNFNAVLSTYLNTVDGNMEVVLGYYNGSTWLETVYNTAYAPATSSYIAYQTLTKTVYLDISANDKIRIRARCGNGATRINQHGNATSLIITEI